jgi:hypothetical protein
MKKTALKMVALLSGILIVCFAVQLYKGWNGADFARHALISSASAAFTWRCWSLASRGGVPPPESPRLGFALRVAFWLAVAVALFVGLKATDY